MGKTEQRESFAGSHYHGLFQECPRKFMFSYIKRLRPKHTAPALISGAAFHQGKAAFYKSRSMKKGLEQLAKEFDDRKGEYEDIDQYLKDRERFSLMLESWIEQIGKRDLKNYKVLAVEKQIEVRNPYVLDSKGRPMLFTVRADTILVNSVGDITIMETKTTQFSKFVMERTVAMGDQATAYIGAVRQAYPENNVVGVQPDITYWHKNSNALEKIEHYRPNLVFRTDKEVDQWLQGMASVMTDISQRAMSYQAKTHSEHMLFPRNTGACMHYGKPCPFYDICRSHITESGRAPHGFRRDNRVKIRITDQSSIS